MMRRLTLGLGCLTLAACTSTGTMPPIIPSRSVATAPTTNPAPSSDSSFRAPQVQRDGRLEGVIGSSAPVLLQRFGKARIDLTEGDARKLQFLGENCVLDIFLYPLERGQPPVATHVEARLRNGGATSDPGQCIAEVSARQGTR